MTGIRVRDEPFETGHLIAAELSRSLTETRPQSVNTAFVLSVRDDQAQLSGGLTANTSYGWLLIKTLWVDSGSRGQGIGSALMDAAETRGLQLGCHGAWLDSSNPGAVRFYQARGFESFGQLGNRPGQHPEGHRRWFLLKALGH